MTTITDELSGSFEGEALSPADVQPAPARSRGGILTLPYAHLVIPLLILAVLAFPSVTFMLPATEDYLDEIYQPLQALKFFKTRGQTFHKYGPFPNFVLAPGYGATLLYWKATGSLDRPSDGFPYGFARPFEQMGVLIMQGRVLFLAIGVAALGYLAYTLSQVARSRAAVAFALLFCLATNYALIAQLPSARPDSPMLAFAALALAMYVRMLHLGLSVRRGVAFALFAVFAISSKELAGPMFVMPFLALVWLAWRERPPEARRTIRWSFLTGVAAYALINIVYAPRTWLLRMDYWLRGPGIDADVWGGGSPAERIGGVLQCLLDNLGPGGAVCVPIAIAAFLYARPSRWLLITLPAISVSVLGLAKIQYPADRFYTILCLALFPVAALGFDSLLAARRGTAALRRSAMAAMCVLAGVNIWFATFASIGLGGVFEQIAERHALAQNDRAARYYLFATHPHNRGASRLEHLGLRHDSRSIQQIAAARTNLPDWVYATQGKLGFIEDARRMPARAAMIRNETGFDVAQWRGLEGLGYARYQTVVPPTPAWFPFDWMPAVKEWQRRRTVYIYRLAPPVTPARSAP